VAVAVGLGVWLAVGVGVAVSVADGVAVAVGVNVATTWMRLLASAVKIVLAATRLPRAKPTTYAVLNAASAMSATAPKKKYSCLLSCMPIVDYSIIAVGLFQNAL
jgi:hypothetical protein